MHSQTLHVAHVGLAVSKVGRCKLAMSLAPIGHTSMRGLDPAEPPHPPE
jgi:hypothetical protein